MHLFNNPKKLHPFKLAFGLFFIFSHLLCPVFAKAGQSTNDRITLHFWEFSGKENLMRQIIAEFEKTHPNVEIKLQVLSYGHGFDKILTAIAAGNPPDICELGTTWVEKLAYTSLLTDVTDMVEDIKDKYLLWDAVTIKDKIYGVPWLAGTRLMFYNKDLFRRAGLDPAAPPTTWEELNFAAQKINALDKDIYGFAIFAGEPYSPWQQFLPFIWANGGRVLSEDSSECVINSPENLAAFEEYNKLKEYAIIDRQDQVNNLFANGKIGIQFSGFWNLRLISRVNPSLDYGLALLPKPRHDFGTHASFAGGQVFTIFQSSKHKKLAMEFIKFVIAEKNTMRVVRQQRSIVPTHIESKNNYYYQEYPRERIFFKQLMEAVTPPKHPRWVEIQEILTLMIEKTILTDMPPQKSLQEAEQLITGVLKPKERLQSWDDTIVFFIAFGIIGVILLILCTFQLVRYFRMRRKTYGKDPSIIIFLLPWIATFLIFNLYPLAHSVIVSFSDYDILNANILFTGFKNYFSVLSDKNFYRALWHTTFFSLGTIPFTMILALLCALLINRNIPFKSFFQAGIFLPVSTSIIVIASIFTYIYSPNGAANMIFEKLKLAHPDGNWLNVPDTFLGIGLPLLSIMAMNIWTSFGYYTILFVAGLKSIPESLYEASAIDGASAWQQFFAITIPHLKPILLLAIIINTINSFQIFPEIFTMTRGGPLGSTTTIVYYLYEAGFHKFDMGRASAVAYILFAIIMLFSYMQMRLFKVHKGSIN